MQSLYALCSLGAISIASGATFLHNNAAPECLPCVSMANQLLGSQCSDPVCVVKAFQPKKDSIMNSKDGPMQLMAIYACAQEKHCNLVPAEQAAQQLGLQPPSFLQINGVPTPPPQQPCGTGVNSGTPVKR
mmetsp:Transcript_77040/g.121644  ORF Transcript_77040/g.121644 Transcript_77040/m.121644 type:complete len:131 (+) Transcript_77040:45-437(+)